MYYGIILFVIRKLRINDKEENMGKINLIYKFNGEHVEDGIDVFEFAPILLSFGSLITEAHSTLYPEQPNIAVKIKPIKNGSYIIDLIMFSANPVHEFFNFMHSSSQGQDIIDTLNCIGLLASTSGINLLNLIGFLKGKPKEIKELDSGDVEYTSNNDSVILVNSKVNNLYKNCNIQQYIYRGIAKPLELDCIDAAESYLESDPISTKVSHQKDIVESLKNYSEIKDLSLEEEKVTENTRTLWLHPKRGSYEGESEKWSFRIGDKDEIITVTIKDEQFLNAIKKGEIRLASQDLFQVELLERQKLKNNNLSTSHEIKKVLDYKPAPYQPSFESEQTDNPEE